MLFPGEDDVDVMDCSELVLDGGTQNESLLGSRACVGGCRGGEIDVSEMMPVVVSVFVCIIDREVCVGDMSCCKWKNPPHTQLLHSPSPSQSITFFLASRHRRALISSDPYI
jgi:hypothetical protein